MTWGWEGDADLPPGTSTVTFELAETPDGTRLDLLHADLPEAAVAGHAEGWDHFLPRLVKSMTIALGADDWRPSPTSERNRA